MTKNKQLTKRSNAMKRTSGNSPRLYEPAEYHSPTIIKRRYRFLTNNGTTISVTLQKLLAINGIVNYAANTNAILCDAVKVHKIEVWTPAVAGSIALMTAYSSFEFEKPVECNATCQSFAQPGHFAYQPTGLMAGWLAASSTSINPTLFSMSCTVNTIVEITLSASMFQQDTLATQSVWTSTAAGTLGKIYYTGLDGITNVYPPVGLPTIV